MLGAFLFQLTKNLVPNSAILNSANSHVLDIIGNNIDDLH